MTDIPNLPTNSKRKPTLKTVAAETGFAVTTVSRALKGDPAIAKKTREVVSAAATRLGYVPDRAAQRLRTGRTKVVTLLINPAHEFLGFTNELLSGMATSLRGTGYSITIMPDYIEDDRLAALHNILRGNLADGVVFTRTECFDPRVRLLLERDFPFVSHGRTDFGTPHPFVDYDNEAFARRGAERLIALGCRRLSMVLPDSRFTFAEHLRYGFLSAVREHGVAFEIPDNLTIDSDPDALAAHFIERRRQPDPPDGHVCVGEVVALSVVGALIDSGLVLGKDVNMVAKHASPIFKLLRPRVETVFEDVRATGEKIGSFLIQRMEGVPAEALQDVQSPIGAFEDAAFQGRTHLNKLS